MDRDKSKDENQPIDFSSLLDGLLLNTQVKRSRPDLEAELNEAVAEEELDEVTDAKIKEIKQITNGIDRKLIQLNEPFNDRGFKIKYSRELNRQQLAAVRTLDRPLLVIAGAGSGKTRVITYKVSYLIEKGVNPAEILLLTFTRKAANEMIHRVQRLLGSSTLSGVLGGTFHAFSNYVLRKYHQLIGLSPNFSIIDSEDVADMISLLKTELQLQPKKGSKHFPKSAKIQAIFSKSRNLEMSLEDTILQLYPENEKHIKELVLLEKALQSYKQRSNLLDYDDLLDTLRNSLKQHQHFRNRVQQLISYILVDEYQDTNNTQREIVELLAGSKRNITVVGDDAQSIYAFRGANFENILRFPQSFPDCGVVKIEENYRSTQAILNFTNEIIHHARIGFKKVLFSTHKEGSRPHIKRLPDTMDEAAYIVDTLMALKGDRLEYADFAVLTRAAWQSNYIQAELIKREIPFVVVGGIKFSERRHVKDMVSFLKIVLNPLDAVAWHRILKLQEGIGEVRAREVISLIHAQGGAIHLEMLEGKKNMENLKPLFQLFRDILHDEQSPSALIPKIYQYYQPLLQQLEDDFDARKIDLEIFAEIAGKYEDLEKFLAEFTLDPPSNRYQDRTVPLVEGDEKPVMISTIHSAKGLEWHTVFIPFALDGILPSVRAIHTAMELEEERRLFYVAASRAKENLYITMPAYVSSWDATFTKPSRFLQQIAPDAYQLEK